MAKGILGRKVGMTQIFDDNGVMVPVTVVDVSGNVVLQQKTVETDGYIATQVGFDDLKESRANKPELGHAKKAATLPKRFIRELRFITQENELANLELGEEVKADIFNEGDLIDVTGTSKGKGFQGNIKRHNHTRGGMSHGSRYHRGVGSMGAVKGRLKGKRLPGHMGNVKRTIQNVKIQKVDLERQLILISGSIPGPKKGFVVIKTAVKSN